MSALLRIPFYLDRSLTPAAGLLLLGVAMVFSWSSPTALQAAETLDYGRDVRPILADKCFRCHGPDEDTREAELRLDTLEGQREDRGGYAAVTPGAVSESELVARIRSSDPDLQMPPADAKKPLTKEEIETLEAWVRQGAPWRQHWAFVKPQQNAPPAVDSSWPLTPIDNFLFDRMRREGLQPSPDADPLTLVRRVYLDLTGLPPTPEEADRWATRLIDADGEFDDGAWEQLVDQLLASPEYAPRWARRWLDLARYADTNGYEKDRDRSIWPYRDWVIRAIENDMPFDQFTIEQLAGDLLPNPTDDQLIATGFHRNTMLNEEGGIDPLEFRFHAMTDRVATTGATWLGLTLGCAQCHTHKYDPVSHREYFQIMAFLNNADEPYLELPTIEQRKQRQRQLAEADRLFETLPEKWTGEPETLQQRLQTWFEQRRFESPWQVLRADRMESNLPHLENQPDDSIFVSGDSAKHDTFNLHFDKPPQRMTAILIETLPDERLPARGPGATYYEGTIGDFFLGELQVVADGKQVKVAEASHSYAKNRYGSNPVGAELAIDGDLQTGWSVHDRQGERHTAVFRFAEPIRDADTLSLQLDFGRHFASPFGRFRIAVTSADSPPPAREYGLETEALFCRPLDELNDEQRAHLTRVMLMEAEETKETADRIRQLRKPPTWKTTLILRERPPSNPRPTNIHHRGEYLQPKETVEATTLGVLHPFPESAERNRLGFARWLVDRENPLTARVVVNRHWAAIFGRGIVPTVADFGLQGQPPSHPELLDWLAVQFMEDGWSIKRLHKRLVMSRAYRQSSQVTETHRRTDPANRWLARAPRYRLDAEVIRDSILAAAGKLSKKRFGPPTRPPQPQGVTEAAYGRPKWKPDQGEDRYRRSVYTFIKRTAPFAMYLTFDGPTGESCLPKRNRSNTPLQALTLMNDVMFVEAAQAMGKQLAELEGDDATRIKHAFRRLLTRSPNAKELAAIESFLAEQRKRIAAGEIEIKTVSGAKEEAADQDEQVKQVEQRAAWTLVARALFSLDETITRN